ncbi:phage virion morphogenesis protein [Pseudomonas citronellolis]|uniref:Phage virion morphogenesis protein n=1 Tax=Pseudomonas citronellolis TaxID=53408 RepID=A0AAW6NZR5_9PSED|nr:phage virion morphogenesis protein [Pseudomonas citronellolis]AMO73845.1 Phage virion morphogenesis family protein [Pseudomonas citronellolis]MDF3840481.1 phage virion morphogenesis protein [Pseudomonas citronellolis]WRT82946.1 phage virion morphogenesis protein [Pseudomonas citronellolis]
MSGAAINVNLLQDPRLARRLDRLAELDLGPLLEGIGAEVESQTRRRIQVDKMSPANEPWPEWSADYAETRHSGQSLLQGAGHLLDSLTYQVMGDSVLVGSPLVYAATHQFGDEKRGIPQREFLGLEGDDLEDVIGMIEDYLEDLADE